MDLKIDIIILTKNEEDVLEKAIHSVKGWAESIFIIDDFSTDKTYEIAKKNHVQFFTNKFVDFSQQRNFGIKKAKSDWVMYLDADERLTGDFKKELEIRISENKYLGFEIKRKTYYFGHDWGFEDKVTRVFRLDKFKKWQGVVHESASLNGEVGVIESPIEHFTHRNLSQMITKTNSWSDYEAKLRFDASHPKMQMWRFIRVMVSEFFRSYIKEKGYKNGTYGLIESIYQSYSIFITYAKLWEMQNTKR